MLVDEQGGLFANPVGARVLEGLGRGPDERAGFHRQDLRKPGLKVLHIPNIDFLTHCALFVDCLQQVKAWSDENPDHVPVFILINAKEKGAGIVDGVKPVKFSARSFDRLDETINRVFAPYRLITPDEVRGTSSSLRQAVVDGRWPALSDTRGQVAFIFDGDLQQANIYRQGHASLAGRAMFAAVPENDPEAAILVINDPVADRQKIWELVSEGFIVRTRSAAGYQTIEQMRRQYGAVVSSGAQIISSDCYQGSPNAERRGYAIPRSDQ